MNRLTIRELCVVGAVIGVLTGLTLVTYINRDPELLAREGVECDLEKEVWITLNIKGAVCSPGEYRVKKGTRLEELVEFIAFSDDADYQFLRKRRVLRNNETLKIPECD